MSKSKRAEIGSADSSVELRTYLLDRYGPLLHGEALWRTLAFPTADAFARAFKRGTVPVHTFEIAKRRGRFANTLDVAKWLSDVGRAPVAPEPTSPSAASWPVKEQTMT